MNSDTRLKVEMAVRVRNFLRANPFGEAKADGVVARFEERVDRAQSLMAQQENGLVMARAARGRRAELRRQLRAEPFRHLTEIAKAAAIEKSELAGLFPQLPSHPSEQEFRAAAQAFATRAAPHKELLREYGMRETALEELQALLVAYDQAVSDADGGRRGHTGARAELKTIASELVKMSHQINGMLLYRIRQQPELRGAWESARNIAWPLPRPAGGTSATGTDLPPATPDQSAA